MHTSGAAGSSSAPSGDTSRPIIQLCWLETQRSRILLFITERNRLASLAEFDARENSPELMLTLEVNMARLIVTAAASPLFGDFLMLVSVSSADGQPIGGLGVASFKVGHLASLNHASPNNRPVAKASEGPAGFYTLQLLKDSVQPTLPTGHYVLSVSVTANKNADHGQTVAVGDMVS